MTLDAILDGIVANTIFALLFVLLAMAVTPIIRRRPALGHLIWLAVILRLLMPPIVAVDSALPSFAAWTSPASTNVVEPPTLHDDDGCVTPMPRVAGPTGTPPSTVRPMDGLYPLPVLKAEPLEAAPIRTNDRSDLAAWLFAIWALGAGSIIVIHARRVWNFRKVVAVGEPAPPQLRAMVRRVALKIGVRAPRTVVIGGVNSPVVWALGKPVLVWPKDSHAVARNEAVVAHELAHLKRLDHRTAWFELFAAAVLWWHPLFHVARRQLRIFAELASDAWVVALMPDSRRAYAETLLDVASKETTVVQTAAAFGVGGVDRKAFERRLQLIMRENVTHRAPQWAALLGILAMLIAPTAALTPQAEKKQDESNVEDVERMVCAAVDRNKADLFFGLEEWLRAAMIYDRVVEKVPDDGKAMRRLFEARLNAGQPKAAIKAARAMIEMQHDLPKAWFGLACAQALLEKKSEARASLTTAVAHGFAESKALRKSPYFEKLGGEGELTQLMATMDTIRELSAQSIAALEEKRFDEAAVAFRKLTALAPSNGRNQHLLGYCLIGVGKMTEAEVACRRQIALGHRVPTGLYNLACINARSGDRDGAITQLRRALDAGFDGFDYILTDTDLENIRKDERFSAIAGTAAKADEIARTAKAAWKKKDWAVAAKSYGLMANFAGRKPPETGMRHGEALLELERYADAVTAFEGAILAGAEIKSALIGLARAHAGADDTDRAFARLERAVEAGFHDGKFIEQAPELVGLAGDPRMQRVWNLLADRQTLGDFNAVDWEHLRDKSTRRLAKEPEDGSAWLKLGWAELRTGRFEKAIHAFNKQDEVGFAIEVARYNVACSYAKMGKSDRALEALTRAMEAGLLRPKFVLNDPDMTSLREIPRFAEILDEMKERVKEKKATKVAKRAD